MLTQLWVTGFKNLHEVEAQSPGPRHIDFAPIPTGRLELRLAQALDAPCNLLFVHRDSEREDPAGRQSEINDAWAGPDAQETQPVTPVRMTETWRLFEEDAIRLAAGDLNGTAPLHLPKISRIAQLSDPKGAPFNVLRTASGQTPNRLRRFRPQQCRHRVADWAHDFSQFRALPSFQRLETQVRAVFQH
ncbi:MAG: hypothetical protein QE285_01795 [Aquabacterium sp.]|nr:hypothetical protein [Aquabacterium sp.]